MPLVYTQKINEDGSLLVWKITESDQFFRENVSTLHNFSELAAITHPLKKREWLAGRYLMEVLCKYLAIDFKGIYKDQHGKPFLREAPFHISITHTADYVAIVAHPNLAVGIDMEKPSEKLVRVQPKFLVPSERTHAGNSIARLAIYWSAKEALYKLNGRKKVPFSSILISPFQDNEDLIEGSVEDELSLVEATIYLLEIDTYRLTVALEKQRITK